MDDDIKFTKNINFVPMRFMVAHRPGHSLEIESFKFVVDGNDVPQTTTGKLPGDQGIWAFLGDYPSGQSLKLDWEFKTGSQVPFNSKALLGYFPDGRIREATRFKLLELEIFQTYSGSVEVNVV